MASEPCDACGEDVPIGGGISGMWSSDPQGTGGMTLEFPDGSEFFLCFDCIDDLPEEPTAADVADAVEE
ncbi:DUF7561 family protein [Natronomonas marina]|jgi:hypothetical protein|uniref:DUF7561 family protein n=1 Tax=Natronomonas marina TaxID=2961939 RepID=UPI0020CA1128|nr:hypothetical protein [Natronomonas marina]